MMTADPSYSALRAYNRCVAGLMTDPEVTGDLLLVGMWLARAVHLRDPEPGEGRWATRAVAAAVLGPRDYHVRQLRDLISGDRPHYDPRRDQSVHVDRSCRAPMIRRAGECGQYSTMYEYLTDLSTGRAARLTACRRHKPWYDLQIVVNRQQVQAAGDSLPRPAANAGGLLARHIPNGVNWPKLWRMVDPSWVAPPETGPVQRPTLRLVRGDEFEPTPEWSGRPALVVHEGGAS